MSELKKFVVTRHREISIIYGATIVEAHSSDEAYAMALNVPLDELTPPNEGEGSSDTLMHYVDEMVNGGEQAQFFETNAGSRG